MAKQNISSKSFNKNMGKHTIKGFAKNKGIYHTANGATIVGSSKQSGMQTPNSKFWEETLECKQDTPYELPPIIDPYSNSQYKLMQERLEAPEIIKEELETSLDDEDEVEEMWGERHLQSISQDSATPLQQN